MQKHASVNIKDGPASPLFKPLAVRGKHTLSRLERSGLSASFASAAKAASRGECVFRGIPFRIAGVLVLCGRPEEIKVKPFSASWLVFLHLSDSAQVVDAAGKPLLPYSGHGRLGEHAADYVILYADGSEERISIRRRYEISSFDAPWGEDCVNAVRGAKPMSVKASATFADSDWGRNQTRVTCNGGFPYNLFAWRNPHPARRIAGLRFEPITGGVLLAAVSAGSASSMPLRWESRRKAVLTLPKGVKFSGGFDANGLLEHLRIDLGQVISACPKPLYPNASWSRTYNNRVPELSQREILVEYSAHPDASFYLPGGKRIPVARLNATGAAGPLEVVAPATERVTLEVRDKATGRPVAVRLHVHGRAGEYLAPADRHRIINTHWYEDYSVDFSHQGIHHCTYIPGVTTIDLPVGAVHIEVSKGCEVAPLRKVVRVRRGMGRIVLELEKVLPWRERGWVTADTHVHFLSPTSALLEGAGEGVNVVNLLASQWGELMTNVGDFDGHTTHGARDCGGDGEYLVRVGTENRQRVLGHISLLGYEGRIISPMTTGGPDESAIGDPVGCLLTEWGRQCKAQGGLVVLPHFPVPRLENASAILSGAVDAVEMSSRSFQYKGINPYSLLDWYRYLNNGYLVAAVGGTDKMEALTAVGTLRTYARIAPSREFTYDAWKDAVRSANTFVTCGPLVEFEVEGRPAGSRIRLPRSGGTIDVSWTVATVTMPASRIEVIVNGEVRESRAVEAGGASGSFPVRVERSSWVALLVRGHYRDKPEIIAAHTSPVMVEVEGSPFFAAADAVTILDQIEGTLAFIDAIGTRADTKRYKEMRLVLTAAHRSLHNRLHEAGYYHEHSPGDDHPEHH